MITTRSGYSEVMQVNMYPHLDRGDSHDTAGVFEQGGNNTGIFMTNLPKQGSRRPETVGFKGKLAHNFVIPVIQSAFHIIYP